MELHSASSALTITLVAADYNFETVVREFYDDVYRFACSQAKADADAADLTQQTFPAPVKFPPGAVSVPVFRNHMAYFANQHFVLAQNTKDLEEARAWLASRGFPVYEATPEVIARFEGMGCKAIDWHGIKVGLVCFRNDSDHIVHLFVVDAAAFQEGGASALLAMKRQHDLETQGWEDGQSVYLFVDSEPKVSLQGLL